MWKRKGKAKGIGLRWFPRGIGEQAIEERNTIYTLEDKRTTEQALGDNPAPINSWERSETNAF